MVQGKEVAEQVDKSFSIVEEPDVPEIIITPADRIEASVDLGSQEVIDTMAPAKIPPLPPTLRFDKNDHKAYKTFSGFRKNISLYLSLAKAADDPNNWNVKLQKRLVVMCLGEVEQLMVSTLITETSLDIDDETNKVGTIDKFLDEIGKVFMPQTSSKLAQEAFERARQGPTETIDCFQTRLRTLFSQAYAGKEGDRQDILVQKFTEGLSNTMARYAINSREEPVGTDIELAVKIANASVCAQIAEAPRSRRFATQQGLNQNNIQSNEALTLISQLEPANSAAPYNNLVQGSATNQLNQTVNHTQTLDTVEPMEIGALSTAEPEDEYVDPEVFNDPDAACLIEGMLIESQSYVNALNNGKNVTDLSCFYCDIRGHLIRDCQKRKTDLKNGIRRGAGRGRGGGSNRGYSMFRPRGGNFRGQPNGRYNWIGQRGNTTRRGGYAAGLAQELDYAPEASSTHTVNEEMTQSLGAMSLQDEQLEKEIETAFAKDQSTIGAIYPNLDFRLVKSTPRDT